MRETGVSWHDGFPLGAVDRQAVPVVCFQIGQKTESTDGMPRQMCGAQYRRSAARLTHSSDSSAASKTAAVASASRWVGTKNRVRYQMKRWLEQVHAVGRQACDAPLGQQ